VRRDADPGSGRAHLLDLVEVRDDRLLPEAGKPAARVGDVQEDDLDARRSGCLDRGERLRQAEVVELAHGRVPGGAHLAVRGLVGRPHELGRLALGLREHSLAPGPEIAPSRASPERALERVAVRVDETRQRERLGHGRRR
jgi:hypothetical protein